MKRLTILLVPALALAVAACSSSAATPSSAVATPEPTEAATPEPTEAATPEPTEAATPEPTEAATTKDIVATAMEAGTFSTLLTAATAAGLVDTLKGEGPFTVFAPTDEAFAALPEGTLEGLLADPEALKQVLLYHVVSGKVTADQVVGLTSADSVEGSPIAIAVKDGSVFLNDTAEVVTTDVMASNGVIHVIDSVILPPTD